MTSSFLKQSGAFIEERRSSFDGLFFRLRADELQNEKRGIRQR